MTSNIAMVVPHSKIDHKFKVKTNSKEAAMDASKEQESTTRSKK